MAKHATNHMEIVLPGNKARTHINQGGHRPSVGHVKKETCQLIMATAGARCSELVFFFSAPPPQQKQQIFLPSILQPVCFFGAKEILPQKVQTPFKKNTKKIFLQPLAGMM